MLPLYGRLFGATVDNMIRVGEAWGEILALSPRVMVMRTDAALAAMVHPPVALDGEPVRMVVEKFDALAEIGRAHV